MVGVSTMADDDMIPDYVAQMESFKRSDEAREALLADIIRRYADLMQEHNNLKNDYTSEKDIRRNYQNEISRMQMQLGSAQRDLDTSSFVLALIDGDGVIFQDFLLQSGAQGGSEAASKLHYAIRDHIASIYSNSSHWPVMVHIYLSLDNLSKKLATVGLLKHPQELRMFAQSFSVNQPLFTIIDVGQGKERADYRIKEMLRTFSDNPTCKHIIFGGCHDAGYLLNLDQYKHNQNKAARITLLESTPAYRGYMELPNFRRTRFDSVFKPEPLLDSTYPQTAPGSNQIQPTFPTPIRTMTNRTASPVATTAPAPPPAPTKPAAMSSSPSTTASSLASGAQAESPSSSSWATVGKTSTASKGAAGNGVVSMTIGPKSANASKKKYVYYNKDGHRLDEPLPPKDRNAFDAIEKRMEKGGRNLCNHWHLNNRKCNNGDFCNFQHDPKLTPAEENALRYKTRSLACKRRDCENFDCYLGHQCAFERDQGHCPYPNTCNLRASHGMDKTKYERWDEDDNVEYSKT